MSAAAVFRDSEPGRHFLLLIVHHLIVDVISWEALIDDLNTAYKAILSGTPLRLPAATHSFGQWALKMQSYANSDRLKLELNHWMHQLQSRFRLPLSPVISGDTVLKEQLFTIPASAAMNTLARSGSMARVALVAALVSALQHYPGAQGTPDVSVLMEGHGREVHMPLNCDF